jgi:hypothetical protein
LPEPPDPVDEADEATDDPVEPGPVVAGGDEICVPPDGVVVRVAVERPFSDPEPQPARPAVTEIIAASAAARRMIIFPPGPGLLVQ